MDTDRSRIPVLITCEHLQYAMRKQQQHASDILNAKVYYWPELYDAVEYIIQVFMHILILLIYSTVITVYCIII